MDFRLNREIKAYCRDFDTVRRLLREHGAEIVAVKEQVDHSYRLPPPDPNGADADAVGNRRLKLRVESGHSELIYYCEGQESGGRTSRFQTAEANDPLMLDVLAAALGIRATVRKRRELWRRDNVVFNLDTVDSVGRIFEVEVQARDGCDIDARLSAYRRLFAPCLGGDIVGSNEDLVSSRLEP